MVRGGPDPEAAVPRARRGMSLFRNPCFSIHPGTFRDTNWIKRYSRHGGIRRCLWPGRPGRSGLNEVGSGTEATRIMRNGAGDVPMVRVGRDAFMA